MNMALTYSSLFTNLEENASTIKGLKNQVGRSSILYFMACTGECTYGGLLHDKSCLHSDLYMSTLVVNLTQIKFLSMSFTRSGGRNGSVPSLLFKRKFCSVLKIFLLN